MAFRAVLGLGLTGLACLAVACGGEHARETDLDQDAEPALMGDAEPAPDAEVTEPDAAEEDEDAAPDDEGDEGDAGDEESGAPQDAALDAEVPEAEGGTDLDAGALDASERDAADEDDAAKADTGTPLEGDAASALDASDAAPTDVCATSPSACHPLRGSYVARTQLYARQQSSLAGEALDLVSKGVLLSTVTIDADGRATEQYCAFEIRGQVFSWTTPTAIQKVPSTQLGLVASEAGYTRPLSEHRVDLSFAPNGAPADCTPGQVHASGCLCPESDALPTKPNDCRVRDLDQDSVPGLNMYVGAEPSPNLGPEGALMKLSVAAQIKLGWQLPKQAGERLLGQVRGGFAQSELSRVNETGIEIGPILNAMCPAELGHIELVKSPLDCAGLLAARSAQDESYGLFDVTADGQSPAVDACPDPSCPDGKRDACGVCDGPGIPSGACDCAGNVPDACGVCGGPGIAPGTCDCAGTPQGVWYADRDGDGKGDPAVSQAACSAPPGFVGNADDSDPTCATTRDTCNVCGGSGVPSGACDCAGTAPSLWYDDSDGDGLGNPAISLQNCTQPTGFVADASDSDPGCAGARDACNVCGGSGIPAGACDCQGHALDACGVCNGPGRPAGACDCDGTAPTLWYEDADGDGQGNPAISVQSCAQPSGFVANASDAYPTCAGVPDVCGVCNGKGYPTGTCDCSGTAPDACGVCGGDGQSCAGCDGVPNSAKVVDACGVCGGDGQSCAGCDGVAGSGKKLDVCGVCGGSGFPAGTCDCSGTAPAAWYADLDGDGLGDPAVSTLGCTQPAGYVSNAADPFPGCATAPDVCGVCGGSGFPAGTCDCTGATPPLWYADTDGDGLGDPAVSTAACTQPAGYVDNPRDTDPSCASARDACGVCGGGGIPPGACDCAGNVRDTCGVCGGGGIPPGACDCTGRAPALWYADPDADGLGDPESSTTACSAPAGYVNNANDTDPSCGKPRDACGVCGGPNLSGCPLLGTYGVRSITFAKGRSGSTVSGSKAVNYSLVTITANGDGTLSALDQSCYSESLPITGDTVYSWSKASWVQAMPARSHKLTPNPDGTWTRIDTASPLGWDPARRPTSCRDSNPSGTASPLSPWPSNGGGSCACNRSTDALPPFNKSAPYDCRLLDIDGDGYPGISSYVSTSAPSGPNSDASGLTSARVMLASLPAGIWTITPDSAGKHKGTLQDQGQSSVVGCSGFACIALSSPPVGSVCPAEYNTVQFAKLSAGASCGAVVNSRQSLFPGSDGSLPNDSVCPPP